MRNKKFRNSLFNGLLVILSGIFLSVCGYILDLPENWLRVCVCCAVCIFLMGISWIIFLCYDYHIYRMVSEELVGQNLADKTKFLCKMSSCRRMTYMQFCEVEELTAILRYFQMYEANQGTSVAEKFKQDILTVKQKKGKSF